jgi:hypothetical protein
LQRREHKKNTGKKSSLVVLLFYRFCACLAN